MSGECWYVMPRQADVPLYISSVESIFTNDSDPKKDIWLSLRWFYRPFDIFNEGKVPEELRGDIHDDEIFRTDFTDEQRLECIGARCNVVTGADMDIERGDSQFKFHCRRSYHSQSQTLGLIPVAAEPGNDAGDQTTNGHAVVSVEGVKPVLHLNELGANRLKKCAPRALSPPANIVSKMIVPLGAKNVEKAQELAVDLLRIESVLVTKRKSTAWNARRGVWIQNVQAAQSIRDLGRGLLDLEEGIGIQNYRNSDIGDIKSWRVRIAGLHTYASIEYHIKVRMPGELRRERYLFFLFTSRYRTLRSRH